MPIFYSPPFSGMCDAVLEIANTYPEKQNVLRQQQIAEMKAVVVKAKSDLAKHAPGSAKYKEAEEKAHQQVETILTYVLESIRQERQKLKLPEKETLYEMIQKALGVDETTQQANNCNAFLMTELPSDAKIQMLPPKSFIFYQVRFPEAEEKDYVVVRPVVWLARYYDEAKREHIVPIGEVPGLEAALKKMNKNKTFSQTEQSAIKNLILPYHIKANANTLDDPTIFVNLVRLWLDVSAERWTGTHLKKGAYLAHLEQLMMQVFNVRLKDFNAKIARRRPTYSALLRTMNLVEGAKGTDSMLSGNQAQLLAFLKKAHMRLTRDEKQSFEDKRTTNNPVTPQPSYAVRYGLLLYCILIYERDYTMPWKWDFFEQIKSSANIPKTSNMDTAARSFYLSALDTYITGILENLASVKEFEGPDGLKDAKAFLTEMQTNIGKFRETLNKAAAHGVSNTKAYQYMETVATCTADAAVYAGIFEMLQLATTNPATLLAQPELAALVGTIYLMSKARKPISAAVTYFVSPSLSEKIVKLLVAICSGAQSLFDSGTLNPPNEHEGYLTACRLAPLVPDKFKEVVRSIADCPSTIPMQLALPPHIKAVAAAAIEHECPAAESGWNLFKRFG